MKRTLVIISTPRTGSNFLCHLLNSLKEFEFFYEIYHPDTVYAPYQRKVELIQHCGRSEEIEIGRHNFEDKQLMLFAKENPKLFFEAFRDTSPNKYFGFKIFQYHLSQEYLEKIFLNDPDVTKLVLTRNILDVYSSHVILEETSKISAKETSINYDTSDFQVTFDPNHFEHWLSRNRKFYSFIDKTELNSNQRYLRLDYSDIHCHEKIEEKVNFISNFLIKSGFEIDLNQQINKEYFPEKQNRRQKTIDRFSNPFDLEEYFYKNRLERFLK